MSRVSNEVFDTPFSAIELTNSINRVPFRARSLDTEFEWETTLSPTTGVRINIGTETGVEIAPYVPRGGVPPKVGEDDRSAVSIEIPAIAARAEAMNREALNVTAGLDGEDRLMSLEMLRDQKARRMARAIDEGEARQCVEAIKGLGTDPKTGRTVFDLYKLLGQKQMEFDLDLGSGVYGLNEQLEDIKEASEQAVGGAAAITGFKLIMADVASRKIRSTKDYKEILTNNATATILAKIDGRKNVVINDNVDLVHYRFGHLDPNDAFLVPIYAGHAQIVYGPHESDEFWGKILARYVTSEPMPHGKGIEMEAWSYVLRYFQHPEAIFKIKLLGGV